MSSVPLPLPGTSGSHVAVDVARRGERLVPLLLAVLTASFAIWAIEPWPVGVFQDDGIYTILGKALASGEGYRYLNLPGAPPATHYPPGYPLVLALLWRVAPVFPQNTAVFVFANVAFLTAGALGTWYYGRRQLAMNTWAAGGAALGAVCCVPALVYGLFVLSEPLFVALLLPTLLLAERSASSGRLRDAALAGLAAGALSMVRTMGQFLVPALVLVLVLRRRWRAAGLVAAGAALFLVPWQLWVAMHGDAVPPVLVGKYGPYTEWVTNAMVAHGPSFVWQVVLKNLNDVHALTWSMFTGNDYTHALRPALSPFVTAALVAVMALGLPTFLRRAPVTVGFIVMYVTVVILWPFEPTRFLWVLLPLLGLGAVAGVQQVLAWRPAAAGWRGARVAVMACVALLLVGYGAYNTRAVRERWWITVPRNNGERAKPLVAWALEHSQPGDLLATDDDPLVHLYTGRRTVPVGTFTPEEYLTPQTVPFMTSTLETLIDTYHPRYVLCGSMQCAYGARNLLWTKPPRLRVVEILERGVVFEPLSTGAPQESTGAAPTGDLP